jgi:hypothetical protein
MCKSCGVFVYFPCHPKLVSKSLWATCDMQVDNIAREIPNKFGMTYFIIKQKKSVQLARPLFLKTKSPKTILI